MSAREIEELLARHPAVAEVAVLGVPDPLWGEAVAAVVAPRAGAARGRGDEAALLEDLAAFVSARLADYKKPRALRLVESLPRNAMGKIEKHRLAALFAEPGPEDPAG